MCSPLAYSIQAPELTPYQELCSSDLKTIAQRLEQPSLIKRGVLNQTFPFLTQLPQKIKIHAKKIITHTSHTNDVVDIITFFYLLLRDALFP